MEGFRERCRTCGVALDPPPFEGLTVEVRNKIKLMPDLVFETTDCDPEGKPVLETVYDKWAAVPGLVYLTRVTQQTAPKRVHDNEYRTKTFIVEPVNGPGEEFRYVATLKQTTEFMSQENVGARAHSTVVKADQAPLYMYYQEEHRRTPLTRDLLSALYVDMKRVVYSDGE